MSKDMSKPAHYTPEPGSLAARVLDIFSKAPDEYFTSGDLGAKLTVPSNSMRAYLKVAVEYGLLKNSREPDDEAPYWRAGPRFSDWLALQKGEPAPALVRKPAAKRTTQREALPPIDLAALVIKSDVPKPARTRFCRSGISKYDQLLKSLQPGQSAELPAQYMATLYTHCKKVKKRGQGTYTVQRTSTTHCTLWRDA